MSQNDTAIREVVLNSVGSMYTNLIQFINRLNINPRIKEYAFQNLDQGLFWIKEAVAQMSFEAPPAPVAPETVVENNVTQDDLVKENIA